MQEFLARTKYLDQQNQLMSDQRARDSEFVHQWQAEKKEYEKWAKTMQRTMAENPFVLVLIDGDGMIVSSL
jgi:hypothetical protein